MTIRPALTELERLQRRLKSWRSVRGPPWMLRFKPQTIAELETQIAELEAAQHEHCED